MGWGDGGDLGWVLQGGLGVPNGDLVDPEGSKGALGGPEGVLNRTWGIFGGPKRDAEGPGGGGVSKTTRGDPRGSLWVLKGTQGVFGGSKGVLKGARRALKGPRGSLGSSGGGRGVLQGSWMALWAWPREEGRGDAWLRPLECVSDPGRALIGSCWEDPPHKGEAEQGGR